MNMVRSIAAHTGCTIAGLPRFFKTALRRTFARKAHGGRSFPGPSAYCVVHCCLVLQSELGVANFQFATQLPRQLLSVCRRLRCDLGPETSTNTALQLSPVPRRRARDGASAAGLANASQAWRARARTTRHARTCPPCPCAHNVARPHLQRCDRGVYVPGASDDGPPAAGEGGTCCLRTSCRAS